MPPASTLEVNKTNPFEYTPPSYLLRAKDKTNRPWSKTDDGEGVTGDNDYEIAQEDRPQTRRESHLDAHFQQRVRNKQSRYRNILSGDEDPEHNNAEGEGDDDDSVLAAVKNVDSSFSDINIAKIHIQSASNNQQARKNRKERITGIYEPRRSSSTASDAENARNLRAHRLRTSLLKQTPEEYDLQEKLEARRIARREEEAAARRAERDAKMNDPTFENDTISKRKNLEQKRKAYEREREARAKDEAAEALIRAAELNEERIRQRDRERRAEDRKTREDRRLKRAMKKKNYNGDDDTLFSDLDGESDFAFLSDLQGIVRDSGILTSCGSCFGSSPNSEEEGKKTDPNPIKAYCGAISSVFVPDLTPSSDTSHDSEDGPLANDGGTIRRTREYAKYRE